MADASEWIASRLLSGKANLTVRTLAGVAFAMDVEVKLEARSPARKMARKPLGTGSQQVVYKKK